MLDGAGGSPHTLHPSGRERSRSPHGRCERGRHGATSNPGMAKENPEMNSFLRLFRLLFIVFGLDALQADQFLLLTQADQRDALGIAAKR